VCFVGAVLRKMAKCEKKNANRTILNTTAERDLQPHNSCADRTTGDQKIANSLKFACQRNGQSAAAQGNVRSAPKSVAALKNVRTTDQ